MHKKSLTDQSPLRQLATQSGLTLISRALGFIRELFFVRIVGTRMIADTFLTALRIPNMLYEMCIGGACAPAILPAMTTLLRTEGIAALSGCLTGLVILVTTVMLAVALTIGYYAESIIRLLAPGFAAEQVAYATTLLPIMALFMVTSAATACVGEALRTLRSMTIPAAGQIIVNLVFIGGLFFYGYYWKTTTTASLQWLAAALVMGGLIQFIVHLIGAWRAGLRPHIPTQTARHTIEKIMTRIVPATITTGIQEVSILIEQQFASYLPIGSIALLFYASSFVRLPFGIFAHALVSTTLPDLARKEHYAPRRVDRLVAEGVTCIGWIMIPMSCILALLAEDIFVTIAWWSPKFPLDAIPIAATVLRIKAGGLLFLGINHVLVQLLYVRHQTSAPTFVALISASGNMLFNLLLYQTYGIYGIAYAGTATTCIRTCLFFLIATLHSSIARYSGYILTSFARTTVQTALCIGSPYLLSIAMRMLLNGSPWAWCTTGIMLWFWLIPVYCIGIIALYYTHRAFGVRLYILDKRNR